jgi:Sugar efflux transporter for intercellular exchange
LDIRTRTFDGSIGGAAVAQKPCAVISQAPDMPVPHFVSSTVAPVLGVLICIGQALVPFPAVLEARKQKALGDLSPIPWVCPPMTGEIASSSHSRAPPFPPLLRPQAFLVNSNMLYTLYSILLRDLYLFFSAWIPLLMSLFLCSTAIHLLEREGHTEEENTVRVRVEYILFGSTCLIILLGFICGFVVPPSDFDLVKRVVGTCCLAGSLCFQAAPLLNAAEIIATKDSSSLYVPALLVNGLSSLLWFVYGLYSMGEVCVRGSGALF